VSAGSGGRGKSGRGEYEREGDRKKIGLTYSNPIKSVTSLRCLGWGGNGGIGTGTGAALVVVIPAGLAVRERHETPWALVQRLTYLTHIQIELLVAVACAVDFPIHRYRRDRGLVVGVGVGGSVRQDLMTVQVLWVLDIRVCGGGRSAQKGKKKKVTYLNPHKNTTCSPCCGALPMRVQAVCRQRGVRSYDGYVSTCKGDMRGRLQARGKSYSPPVNGRHGFGFGLPLRSGGEGQGHSRWRQRQ